MSNRRNFLKKSIVAGSGLAAANFSGLSTLTASELKSTTANTTAIKHWVWINPKHGESEKDLKQRYSHYYSAGIRGIFFEGDSEVHFRTAKVCKLEAHRWIWTMNRGEKSLREANPEIFAINRKGESCADKPPYVDYYRWLCPSKPETLAHLKKDVEHNLNKDYVDGIHLDYVRFCDIILPVNLWKNYKIVQTSELPEYDYCYCSDCKRKFKEQYGQDVDQLEYPEASLSWRLFRYNAITGIVNQLAAVAASKRKSITAAVFPTPEVAKRNVRQDWVNWNLTGVCPMIYHGFYKEPVSWIGDAVNEGVKALNGRFPLYAGVFLPDFKNKEELEAGIKLALDRGARGISLFGDVTEEVLESLEKFKKHT
ncbi:Tat pathway signal protein [Desertivirga brevis]|uniref:Tat pathway signal protein n=1 Tax=Desertivirga brevis TaxID=2810310 RepID=UPI001A97BB3E|nr:Tat pathway signal protein [Pedobacter sp. SYSU D00873]